MLLFIAYISITVAVVVIPTVNSDDCQTCTDQITTHLQQLQQQEEVPTTFKIHFILPGESSATSDCTLTGLSRISLASDTQVCPTSTPDGTSYAINALFAELKLNCTTNTGITNTEHAVVNVLRSVSNYAINQCQNNKYLNNAETQDISNGITTRLSQINSKKCPGQLQRLQEDIDQRGYSGSSPHPVIISTISSVGDFNVKFTVLVKDDGSHVTSIQRDTQAKINRNYCKTRNSVAPNLLPPLDDACSCIWGKNIPKDLMQHVFSYFLACGSENAWYQKFQKALICDIKGSSGSEASSNIDAKPNSVSNFRFKFPIKGLKPFVLDSKLKIDIPVSFKGPVFITNETKVFIYRKGATEGKLNIRLKG